MSVAPVYYSRTALWSVSGLQLDKGLSFSISAGTCDGLTEVGTPGPTLRQFSCRPTSLGALAAEVRDAGGQGIASLRVDVPVPVVRLTLSQGTVDLELDPVAAPVTVSNFLGYVASGFYDNTLMHRVIPGFVIQGGGYRPGSPDPQAKSPTQAPIVLESQRGLSNVRGTLSMARTSDPASATSQFFVNLVDNRFLDYQSDAAPGYAVFGRVIAGLDVIDSISAVMTHNVPSLGLANVPITDVVVSSARQLR